MMNPPARGMSPLRAIIHRVLRRLGLLEVTREVVRCARLIRLGLRETGWRLSARLNVPVDGRGDPVPWFTYPTIALLSERLPANARVFEWGAGHSTVWFSRRVASVVAVEADRSWAAYVRALVSSNAVVIERSDQRGYVEAIKEWPGGFDVVIIDGEKGTRYECGRLALESLSPRGVIVWDNADWPDFQKAWLDYLRPAGFRRLILRGFGPLGWREWETAILYRDGNVLGI